MMGTKATITIELLHDGKMDNVTLVPGFICLGNLGESLDTGLDSNFIHDKYLRDTPAAPHINTFLHNSLLDFDQLLPSKLDDLVSTWARFTPSTGIQHRCMNVH
jgi:hypothetical protein